MSRRALDPHYEILRQLGHGAMAEVLLAQRVDDGQYFAVKRILPHLATQADLVERFAEEARVMPQIVHPNIVRTEEICDDGGAPVIVLEYIEGPSLVAVDRAARAMGPPLSHPAIAHLGGELLSALGYLHAVELECGERGVVHRDVTPSNILLQPAGTTCLIDFGVAFASGRKSLTKTGALVGKVGYMAPEVLRGDPAGPPADLFSTAVILYELLCGAPPFGGTKAADVIDNVLHGRLVAPQSVAPDLDDAIATFLCRGLSLRPEDRFEDAWEMAMDLSAVLAFPDVTAVGDVVSKFSNVLRQSLRSSDARLVDAQSPKTSRFKTPPRAVAPEVTVTQLAPKSLQELPTVNDSRIAADPQEFTRTIITAHDTLATAGPKTDATVTQLAPPRGPVTDTDAE